jgi:hypothetical protein
MGKSVPITLGPFTFRSISAAKGALRAIRDDYEDDAPILDSYAVDLLLGVVATHSQAREKIGVGIAGFFVAKAPSYGTRCFHLRRIDGSVTDFSWNEAITPTKPIERLRMACRNAIEDQKTSFKDSSWLIDDLGARVCPITGEPFDRANAQVDHQPPWTLKALVEAWLTAQGLKVEDVPIDHTGDLRCVDSLADERHRQSWRAFHAKNARLQLVSATGNLRQGARLLDF